MRRELRELKGDESAWDLYLTGVGNLLQSGYINALRALGRPARHNFGKDPNQMASEAAWSAGWNDCLDSLLHFKEMYFPDEAGKSNVSTNFNALDIAVSRGDLTKEDADELKLGRLVKPDLADVTNNIRIPVRPKDS